MLQNGEHLSYGQPSSRIALGHLLEQALDVGGSIIVMSPTLQGCEMYVGTEFGTWDDLKGLGVLERAVIDELLSFTKVGENQLDIDGQVYRFTRSFQRLAGGDAVVFCPA